MARVASIQRVTFAALITLSVPLLTNCATLRERNAVPEAYSEYASVPNLPSVRMWGDALPLDLDFKLEQYIEQRKAAIAAGEARSELNFLAISGGGSNGAFGAGLLVGWTETGTRPTFDLVTGVSTGALAAPFAFLGPAYDGQLQQIYTQISDGDIYKKRGLVAGLAGSSFADSHPLRAMIDAYVTDDLLAAIAAEHDKGRRLSVATTNLDAQRPVYWNMGEIASIGGSYGRKLFGDVLLASASVPGVLPPVHIEVEAGGALFEEIHVDGGTSREVYLLPEVFSIKEIDRRLGRRQKRHLYVIRNGKTTPEYKVVKASTLPIMGRSISTLIKNQSDGDIYRLYATSQRDKIDFNVASIPPSFDYKAESEFDKGYMNALFSMGYQLGSRGYSWDKVPPGLSE